MHRTVTLGVDIVKLTHLLHPRLILDMDLQNNLLT